MLKWKQTKLSTVLENTFQNAFQTNFTSVCLSQIHSRFWLLIMKWLKWIQIFLKEQKAPHIKAQFQIFNFESRNRKKLFPINRTNQEGSRINKMHQRQVQKCKKRFVGCDGPQGEGGDVRKCILEDEYIQHKYMKFEYIYTHIYIWIY